MNLQLFESFLSELSNELVEKRNRGIKIEDKLDGSPVTDLDKWVNSEIKKFILDNHDCHNFISEEDSQIEFGLRSRWEDFWIIDPIDGTKEFIKNKDDYTINVVFYSNRIPQFSVVTQPKKNNVFSLLSGKVYENFRPMLHLKSENKLRVVVSKSHLNKETEDLLGLLEKYFEIETVSAGSSLKIIKLAQCYADIYPRIAPTNEWDTAAADAILEASGGSLVEFPTFEKLSYNKEESLNPPFIGFSNTNASKKAYKILKEYFTK